MKTKPNWQYDEMQQCGVDFSDLKVASEYDEQFQKFADYEEKANAIMEAIDLKKDSTVIDIGCGTGMFVLYAAKRCKKVYAVDISEAMMNVCKCKAKEQGLGNIEFVHAGFLTYEHNDEPVDAVVSTAAMHHLPDLWKSVAFVRIKEMLKPKGKFYLDDSAFSFEPSCYREFFNAWIEEVVNIQGADFSSRIETAIRQEYKTYHWIIEGLLERAGFCIDVTNVVNNYHASYLCSKHK